MTNQHHRDAFILVSLLMQLSLGCTATLDDAAKTEIAVPDSGDRDALTLLSNTNDLLVGTYANARGQLGFELSHIGETHVATLYQADDTRMARMTFDPDRETLELGDELTLEGPPGSLSGSAKPDWNVVTLHGDTSRLGQLSASAEFQLLGGLGRALASRTDIDLTLLPPLGPASQNLEAPPELESRDGSSVGVTVQALSPWAPDCIICMASCTAASALCGQAAGWVGSWVCAPGSTICYAGCLAKPCQ